MLIAFVFMIMLEHPMVWISSKVQKCSNIVSEEYINSYTTLERRIKFLAFTFVAAITHMCFFTLATLPSTTNNIR